MSKKGCGEREGCEIIPYDKILQDYTKMRLLQNYSLDPAHPTMLNPITAITHFVRNMLHAKDVILIVNTGEIGKVIIAHEGINNDNDSTCRILKFCIKEILNREFE